MQKQPDRHERDHETCPAGQTDSSSRGSFDCCHGGVFLSTVAVPPQLETRLHHLQELRERDDGSHERIYVCKSKLLQVPMRFIHLPLKNVTCNYRKILKITF